MHEIRIAQRLRCALEFAIQGRILAVRSGHGLNRKLALRIREQMLAAVDLPAGCSVGSQPTRLMDGLPCGTVPRTRDMTMNGAPSTADSGSFHSMRGTGTCDAAAMPAMMSNSRRMSGL